MANTAYRVLVYKPTGTNFAVGDLIADLANVKNIGWARYLNDVDEAFFTLNQDDENISLLRDYRGKAHVFILRSPDGGGTWVTAWRGLWGSWDATGEDVIFYCYGYASVLAGLLSGWNQGWKNKQVDTIVTALWTRAKTTLSHSQVGFVTTGTIEAPVTTSNGSTALVLPEYRIYRKPILYALKELAAIGMSDTTNVVFFEFAFPDDPDDHSVTFNFYKDESTDQPGAVFEYGGIVRDFNEQGLPIFQKNVLYGIGSGPHDQLLQSAQSKDVSTYGFESFGRREAAVYFPWVRDEEELDRATKRRLSLALRPQPEVTLFLHPDAIVPPNVAGSEFFLGDRIWVYLERGITYIEQYMLCTGVMVLFLRGEEYVNLIVQTHPGS